MMILITRPRDESNILAEELSKYKIKTCIEPLISFSYYKNIYFKDISANYIIGSTRSVDVLEKNFSRFKHILKTGSFYVIGEKVKNRLKATGLKNIVDTFDNSSSLIKFLNQKNFDKKPFIYLCGNIFTNRLLNDLKNLEINIEQKFLYKTIQRKKLTKRTASLIANQKIDSVVLFSSHTAEIFFQLVSNAKLIEEAKYLQFICLSPGISEILKEMGFQNVDHTKSANQQEMVQMIKNYKNI